ncbi:MAG: hypothetical protein R2777_00845 [Chitinophagales bacterium]
MFNIGGVVVPINGIYIVKSILSEEQELNKINVMDLQSGAYILTLTTKKGITYYYRFVKE